MLCLLWNGIIWPGIRVFLSQKSSSPLFSKRVKEFFLSPDFLWQFHLLPIVFIGLTMAHVQILTRLVCAASPYVYILMARILAPVLGEELKEKETKVEEVSREVKWLAGYLVVYGVGGMILHGNHFPWT